MISYYIDKKWKNIASNHTAFCILGGPSSKQIDNLNEIIKNNFTIITNRMLDQYPEASMYITADSFIAREYFEDKEFFLHKFKGGKILKNQAHFDYDEKPIWIKGKRNILTKNPNLIKVIACNEFPCYNTNFTTGQLYKYKGIEYCKQVKNSFLCIEDRNPNGESWPTLSPSLQHTLDNYGTNPSCLISGGNVAGIIFQLLYYMDFKKVVVVGYGDNGDSIGYESVRSTYNDKVWSWSEPELHAMVVHNMKWGDRLKILYGGEVCNEYAPYARASMDDLEQTPNMKNKLINKLTNLN
jgi:hypothetical protein